MLCVFGHLKHCRKWKLIVDATRVPDLGDYRRAEHTWADLRPDAIEEMPPKMPAPKGKPVMITIYKDADGALDVVTRK